jgi:cytochrome c-type biogenesis protein CcmH
VIWFGVAAVTLLLTAVVFVLQPLLRSATPDIDDKRYNLDILRDQLGELESDRRLGLIDENQYLNARADLERRALEEAPVAAQPGAAAARARLAPALVGLVIPIAAGLLYLGLGTPGAIETGPHPAANTSSISPDQFQAMTEQLAARLKERPDDWEGWTMLGRAYKAMQRYEESAQAWGQAAKLKPRDAETLADYAEALAVAKGGDLRGEPTRLLQRALEIDPRHHKALALSGGAAFGREDYKAAIGYWERLLAVSDDEPELKQALQSAIGEANARMQGAPSRKSVSGTVSIAPALTSRVQPGDTVFVFARPADGSRMPLAILRVEGRNLPYDFTLDDTMAMTPSAKLSTASRVVIGARISRSGNAQPSSGDLEGFSQEVAPGAKGVRVIIDREVR